MRNRSIKGSTLVECVASLAIFSLATLIIFTGFLTAGRLIVKAASIAEISDDVMNTLETDKLVGESDITVSDETIISFHIGEQSFKVKGNYKKSQKDDYSLSEFVTKKTSAPSDVIPGTDKPVNGKWPEYEDFENEYSVVIVPKWTTFVRDGKYYIAAQDLDIYPRGSLPTDGWWVQQNNLVLISDRDVIYWSGGTQVEFYNQTGGRVNKGDKVFWDGNYYVFTISGQTWADPPNLSMTNWAKINYPFSQ